VSNNFLFNSSIPATNNNPSDDQPIMQSDNSSIEGIWEEDHIGFNADGGGTHLQMRMRQFSTDITPVGSATEASVYYAAAGIADVVRAQAYFKNVLNIPLPISCIKAFGVFTTSNSAPPPLDNSFNCTISGQGNTYTITLTTNVVSGNNVIVFLNCANGSVPLWSFTNPVLTLTSVPFNGTKCSFIVIQA
jgi:hypothetical protein